MARLRVAQLVWNSQNLSHIRRHGGSVRVCREVLSNAPKFFEQTGRSGSHLMIGPDRAGRFWTIAIDDLGDGRVMAVTAWPSKRNQVRRYEEED
jgi:hypothetical protein